MIKRVQKVNAGTFWSTRVQEQQASMSDGNYLNRCFFAYSFRAVCWVNVGGRCTVHSRAVVYQKKLFRIWQLRRHTKRAGGCVGRANFSFWTIVNIQAKKGFRPEYSPYFYGWGTPATIMIRVICFKRTIISSNRFKAPFCMIYTLHRSKEREPCGPNVSFLQKTAHTFIIIF